MWMPEEDRYACSKECLEDFNAKQLREHEAVLADWDASDGESPPRPSPLPLRKRPDAPIEHSSALPGMKVTRHRISEGDGSRGFTPGIADSRGEPGPSSPLGAGSGAGREHLHPKRRATESPPRDQNPRQSPRKAAAEQKLDDELNAIVAN